MTIQVPSLKFLAGAALVASTAMAHAAPVLLNGDFASGNLNGWTSYLSTNGTIGTPVAASADVLGNGASNPAARLNVGQATEGDTASGGGLSQTFTLGAAGQFQVHADIMSAGNTVFDNADGGLFSLIIDGTAVASHSFGEIAVGTPERATLSGLLTLTAGAHTIRLEALRNYLTSENTPFQYFDNVSVVAVPEASTHMLMLLGLGLVGGAQAWRRRLQG